MPANRAMPHFAEDRTTAAPLGWIVPDEVVLIMLQRRFSLVACRKPTHEMHTVSMTPCHCRWATIIGLGVAVQVQPAELHEGERIGLHKEGTARQHGAVKHLAGPLSTVLREGRRRGMTQQRQSCGQ